jgi:hypothetical protein
MVLSPLLNGIKIGLEISAEVVSMVHSSHGVHDFSEGVGHLVSDLLELSLVKGILDNFSESKSPGVHLVLHKMLEGLLGDSH